MSRQILTIAERSWYKLTKMPNAAHAQMLATNLLPAVSRPVS
jgi:hypothetical protein